jgi:hypothetical protein
MGRNVHYHSLQNRRIIMGGALGKSESQATNQSQFDQNIWGPQGGALGNMYSALGGLFNQTNQGMQGQIPGAVQQQQGVFNQANPAWQQQLGGGAYQGMDLQGDYRNALTGGGNEQFIDRSIMGGQGNDYVDAMRGQMQDDSSQRLGRNLAMSDARASGAGMGGSSRHGLLQARMAEDEGDRLGALQTGVGFNTFDKDLDRKLGIAQRADQFDMGRLQQTGQMLGNQNQAMQGGLNFGQNMQGLGMGQFAPGMAPWQAAGQYAQNIGRPTVLSSGAGSGASDSKGFGASGGVGGGK